MINPQGANTNEYERPATTEYVKKNSGMKNTDMKHYKTKRIDLQTIIAALAIIGLIVVTWTDHTNRSEIARAAQQEIVERDLYIEQLERTIQLIFSQPEYTAEL